MDVDHHITKVYRRRFWIGLSIATLILIFAPLVLYGYWSSIYSNRVSQELAEIARNSEPVLATQLNSMFKISPELEDVTPLWRKSFEPFDDPAFRADRAKLFNAYSFPNRVWVVKHLPRGGEPWPDLTIAIEYLQSHQSLHDQWHKAAEKGGHARWEINYAESDRILPLVDDTRSCLSLLQLEFFVFAKLGNPQDCVKCLRTMLALRNAVKLQPCFWSQRNANLIDQQVLALMADGICTLQIDDADLRDLLKRLQDCNPRIDFRIGLLGLRAEAYTAMREFKRIGEDQPYLPALSYDLAFYLENQRKYIAAFDAPFPQGFSPVLALDNAVSRKAPKSNNQFALAYSSKLLPPMAPVLEEVAKTITMQQAVELGIAAELFRRESGKYPKSLSELIPKWITKLPEDPFTGKAMLYRLNNDGFAIYGAGMDGVDDGGALDEAGADIGLFFPSK